MKGESAVVFCAGGKGHFHRLRPLITGLTRAGVRTYVFSHATFREDIERCGGHHVDLFAGRPLGDADATSVPLPCRGVSFAGHFGDDVVREVATLRPAVIIHDTFAVIGVVVANHLGLPRVNVCAGHNQAPELALEALRHDPRVNVSERCRSAVRLLRERHGMPDASPFSYVTAVSSELNVYCEPPEFLRPEEREPFQPIVFLGSLWLEDPGGGATSPSAFATDGAPRLRLYASFGTLIWRYFADQALGALEAFSQSVAAMRDTVALVSLGGWELGDRAARLARPNVRVERYVDQWKVLGEASLHLTHHGLNSTHEAIFHQTPMISYPFFADQPLLAKRCQELGLAVPLVETLHGPVDLDAVGAALARVAAERDALQAHLAEARGWELAVIRDRPAVIERILGLMR